MIWIACLLLTFASEAPSAVTPLRVTTFTHPELEMTVIGAVLSLPPGDWQLAPTTVEGLEQLHLEAEPREFRDVGGERGLLLQVRQTSVETKRALQNIWQQLASVDRIQEQLADQAQKVDEALKGVPWPQWQAKNVQGPFFFLLRDQAFTFTPRGEEPRPLIVELRPFIDDGHHHILYSDQKVRRVAVDADLLARLGLAVTPVFEANDPRLGSGEARQKAIEVANIESKAVMETTCRLVRNHRHSKTYFRDDEWIRKNAAQLPWTKWSEEKIEGPYYFFIPGRKAAHGVEEEIPLVVELRPFLDDGQHHVLFTNGKVTRVPIDPALAAEYGVVVEPVFEKEKLLKGATAQVRHGLYALRNPSVPATRVTVSLRATTGETIAVDLDVPGANPGNDDMFERWISLRHRSWAELATLAPDSPYAFWASRTEAIYEIAPETPDRWERVWRDGGDRNRGQATSIFNVLGGRAAVRETLQMQRIAGGRQRKSEEPSIPISEIAGVEVKSHDYDQMLAGRPGGSMPLTHLVPHDRFMVYCAQPSALAQALDGGAEFLFSASRGMTRSCLDYELIPRYAERFGMSVETLKLFLQSHAVQDLVVILPDLFLVDGTDLTLVLNIPQMDRLRPILTRLGLGDLTGGEVIEKSLPNGQSTFWVARSNLLILSTHRAELDQVLELAKSGGEGSLGQSAEFRYMLTKLPITGATQAYAYLSDPFIRRLVGPEVKIAQLRRLRARADLEALSSGALLYRHDGHGPSPDLQTLASTGYISENLADRDYRLDTELVAHSDRYGTPSEMVTVRQLSIDLATEEEREAYAQYVQNYSRFWRQFFDPIAMRLEDQGAGSYEAEVFILPLIDSSVYEMVRQVVLPHTDGITLSAPRLDPDPVVMFSVQLNTEAWLEMLEETDEIIRDLEIDPGILGELGSTVHLAILDSDPVLTFGSGDILGVFGGNGVGRRSQEWLFIPALVSVFTRPCKLFVELHDAERVAHYLGGLARWTPPRSRNVSYDLVQIGDQNRWILDLSLFQMIKLRMGVEVQAGYLVISNLPWYQETSIQGRTEVLSSTSLRVDPAAAQRQLSGLHAAAQSQARVAAFRSGAHLQALIDGGAPDPAAAAKWHRELFGFVPEHPLRGTWKLDGRTLKSSVYGNHRRQTQPRHADGDRQFGLLQRVEDLTVSMQLEDDGLRTRFRWNLRDY